MKLSDYKLIFLTIGLIGVILIASPALVTLFSSFEGETYTQLYILGSNQEVGEYPYNTVIGQKNTVYIGVTNCMGTSEYYVLYVKLLNDTDILPNDAIGTPSPVQPIYEYRFVIQAYDKWSMPFVFSIDRIEKNNNQSTIGSMTINSMQCTVNKIIEGNSTVHTSNYRLVFELWIFNGSSIQFHNRFVDLSLHLI